MTWACASTGTRENPAPPLVLEGEAEVAGDTTRRCPGRGEVVHDGDRVLTVLLHHHAVAVVLLAAAGNGPLHDGDRAEVAAVPTPPVDEPADVAELGGYPGDG